MPPSTEKVTVDLGGVTVLYGDCLELLKTLPENSVDSCVTDPPYGLEFMGKEWDKFTEKPRVVKGTGGSQAPFAHHAVKLDLSRGKNFQTFSEKWASEVFRVLKPGGHLVAFGGTRTFHRMACAIEDAGFEIRDSLMWIYGTGFPKSHDVSKGIDRAAGEQRERIRGIRSGVVANCYAQDKWSLEHKDSVLSSAPITTEAAQWEGWGTALKPAHEPIVLCRKPLSEPTVAANVLRWGTGAINVGACRVPATDSQLAEKYASVRNAPSRNNSVYGADKRPRSEGNLEPHPNGRWPANVCHDGSEEVVQAFPNTHPAGSARKGSNNPRQENANRNVEVISGRSTGDMHRFGDSGSAARFFYSAKASKADRAGSKHPTVKPVALMRWLARLITPPGGTVLDPFAGTGTVGQAAIEEGFRAILIEREIQYQADIQNRLEQCTVEPRLL